MSHVFRLPAGTKSEVVAIRASNTNEYNESSCGGPPDLTVVVPVYNEEKAIRDCVLEWSTALDALEIDYEFLLLNDGSSDATPSTLDKLAKANAKLKVRHKANSGHGPTILCGYLESAGKWVFQTDSDRETSPESFGLMWKARAQADYMQGYRVNRASSLFRKIITAGARFFVRILYGKGLRDINCPYRLMKGDWVRHSVAHMPENTLTPNVVLSGWAIRDRLRILEVPVSYRFRSTGEVSLHHFKLIKFVARALAQLLRLRFTPRAKARSL